MRKMKLILNLVIGLGLTFSAIAADKTSTAPKLDQLQVFYQRNPDQDESPRVVLEWDVSKKVCHAKMQENSKSPWIKLAPEKCRAIQTFLTQNWDELDKRSQLNLDARGRSHLEGPHIPLAEIQFSHLKLGVLAHQTETCDTSMTHCEPSSKDPADQLGYLVASTLASAFVNY